MDKSQYVNVVLGLPDDASVRLRQIVPILDYVFSGSASFLTQAKEDRSWRPIWVGPSAPASSQVQPGPMVNYIADPDHCLLSLQAASRISKTLPWPWFNHPDRVFETTRDRVSTVLQGIPGLDVPKAIRSRPQNLAGILADIERHGLAYPVLIRAAGQHGGRTLVRLDGSTPEQILGSQIAYGPDLYITEFRNVADADGFYRRYRFAIVGGQPFIKSVLAGHNWNLHAADRVWTEATIAYEREAIDTFYNVLKPQIEERVVEVYNRLKLDYFGIDCALRPNGDLVLFEANATMNILLDIQLRPDIWEGTSAKIKGALLSLIDDPSRWAWKTPTAVAPLLGRSDSVDASHRRIV